MSPNGGRAHRLVISRLANALWPERVDLYPLLKEGEGIDMRLETMVCVGEAGRLQRDADPHQAWDRVGATVLAPGLIHRFETERREEYRGVGAALDVPAEAVKDDDGDSR